MTRALVLSGGGARGAFQVGMLEELVVHKKLDFHVIRGVSVGALNGAILAQAPMEGGRSQQNLAGVVKQLVHLWIKDIKGNHSVYSDRAGWIGVVAGADSLYSFKPLENLIKKYVKPARFKTSKRDFKVGTVSLVKGTYQEWDSKKAGFLQRIIASASIPAVFPFIDIKNEEDVLVDGGVRNITPLKSAFKAKPDEIYVLLASNVQKPKDPRDVVPESAAEVYTYDQWDDNFLGTKVNAMDVLERTLDILTDEIYLEDIKTAVKWNAIAAAIENLKEAEGSHVPSSGVLREAITRVTQTLEEVKKRAVKIHVLAPTQWFDPDPQAEPGKKNSAINFSPRLIQQAIEHGKEIARDTNKWLYSG